MDLMKRHKILNQVPNIADMSTVLMDKIVYTGADDSVVGKPAEIRDSTRSKLVQNAAAIKAGATYVIVITIKNPLASGGRGVCVVDGNGILVQRAPTMPNTNPVNMVKFKATVNGSLWITLDKNTIGLSVYTY